MQELSVKYIKYDKNATPQEHRRLEHTTAYSLLEAMLKKHFGLENATILKNENGKPYVDIENVHFSISHTHGLAAVVVADKPVGIDCEALKDVDKDYICKFANRFFTKNEIDKIEKSGYSSTEFFKVWTGKEATIKKLGTNMGDIKAIDTTKENLHYSIENGYIICINI